MTKIFAPQRLRNNSIMFFSYIDKQSVASYSMQLNATLFYMVVRKVLPGCFLPFKM